MSDRPNILLITSDQQHYSTLGVVNPRIKTPALDRLAAEGTRFTRAYCPNPVCSPSRSSIITGLYPSVHGCWTIGVKLPEDVPTIGQMLSAAGYATGLIGKAHFQPLASTPESPSLECQP
ncbi:MAG: sulfatase, partial [Chloroflexota bacterium]